MSARWAWVAPERTHSQRSRTRSRCAALRQSQVGARLTTPSRGSAVAINLDELRARPLDPEVADEIDTFEAAIEEYLAGDLSEEVFRVMRLNQGIYGQRQGGTNQMVRVKIPHGRVTPEQLEVLGTIASDVLAGLGPPHHPPERAVPLRPAPRRPGGAPAPRLGRPHQPGGLWRHGAQRGRLPPRRRVPVRGARHHPMGPGRHRPVPAQPDRPAPPPQVQGQLLGLRDRLRPGDVQRRRHHRPHPSPRRRLARARLQGLPGRRARHHSPPGARARGLHHP